MSCIIFEITFFKFYVLKSRNQMTTYLEQRIFNIAYLVPSSSLIVPACWLISESTTSTIIWIRQQQKKKASSNINLTRKNDNAVSTTIKKQLQLIKKFFLGKKKRNPFPKNKNQAYPFTLFSNFLSPNKESRSQPQPTTTFKTKH